jgi:hypothetical protein
MPPPPGGRSQTSMGFTRNSKFDDDEPAVGHKFAPAASHTFEARKKNLDPAKRRDLMSTREKAGAPAGSISGLGTLKKRQAEREERSRTLYRCAN